MFKIDLLSVEAQCLITYIICFVICYAWRRWVGRKIDRPYDYWSVALNILLAITGPFGVVLSMVFTLIMWEDLLPNSGMDKSPPKWM